MNSKAGAMSVGEGRIEYKTDVSLILNGPAVQRDYVLRTTLDTLSVWKAKHGQVMMSPYEDKIESVIKEAAIIDGEVWVFGINALTAGDIVTAVKIAMKHFRVTADVIVRNVYTKNLNVESESKFGTQALINANKELYTGVCNSIVSAARMLGVTGQLNLGVFSKDNNYKIPKNDLHDALKKGGASSVFSDERRHRVQIGNNAGTDRIRQNTNYHLAVFSL